MLRQLNIVKNGEVAEAIVDRVDVPRIGQEECAVRYHFFTRDRRVINGQRLVPRSDVELWPSGRRIRVIYDPAYPARHAHDEQLWAVEWHILE